MPEQMNSAMETKLHHRGRTAQIPIYLGKLLRNFAFLNDWKVIPMAAIIAGLVAMVIRGSFFVSMEGTLQGALALTCVGIWNGCFNSIQSVCRERDIVKREHRSGMHIFPYIVSHMLYQALLCLAQTIITIYVFYKVGVKFPENGLWLGISEMEFGVTLFLISYASDMLSLLVSCLAHSTTAAMTVMPFLMIFQLVFSGGIFALPDWATNLSKLSVSSYGVKCICAQADYNQTTMWAGWNVISRMKDQEIEITLTQGQILEVVTDRENPLMKGVAAIPVAKVPLLGEMTVGDFMDMARDTDVDEEIRDKELSISCTVQDLLDMVGERRVFETVTGKSAEAAQKPEYEHSRKNVTSCWWALLLYMMICGFLAALALKSIDKDKR